MTVNVPWSTLRPNPRDQRERAAAGANYGSGDGQHSAKDGEPEIHWDVTDFGKRMAFGGIVSTSVLQLHRSLLTRHWPWQLGTQRVWFVAVRVVLIYTQVGRV